MDVRQLSLWGDDGIMFSEEDFSSDDEPEEFGFFTEVPQSVLDAYLPEESPPTEELEEFSEEAFGIIRCMDGDEMDLLLEKMREQKREKQRELSYQREIPSLFHLAKELKLTRKEEMLVEAVSLARKGNGYRTITVEKKNGGEREINIPADVLKRVQRRINKHLLSDFLRSKNSFGFSGGNIVDTITPHLRAKSILCVDVKDAFPSVKFDDVFDCLTEGRTVVITGYHYSNYTYTYRYGKVHDYGYFSWYSARIIADLITFKGRLPQGAPTSPRMFDLILDKALAKLAGTVKGTYTRYADNIFFSMEKEVFPRPIRQAILKVIENREFSSCRKGKHRHPGPYFDWHKLKVKRMNNGSAVRLLGLNIIEGKIHNTRDFKRRLRLSLHHLKWLLEHDLEETEEFGTAWLKLQGQMAFARIDTLPPKLVEAYLELQKRLT